MLSKIARVRLRRFHRWAGIVIGVQLLFWIVGGLYFAWMPFKIVKDEDRISIVKLDPLDLHGAVPLSSLGLPEGFEPKAAHLENSLLGVIYRLESTGGKTSVYDALDGKPIPQIEPEMASELAMKQIQSDGRPIQVNLLQKAPSEFKGPVPIYQVSFDDFRQTRLYLDPWTGKVIARRNVFWRIYDFLWMMHIMDFKEREEFNNPWLRTLSFGAFILVVSGYLLFFFGRPPKRESKV